MKNKFILLSLMTTLVGQAQVGINTDNPQASFHIMRDANISSDKVQGLI